MRVERKRFAAGCQVAIADFTLAAVPRLHDPDSPLVLVRSKLATANTTA